MVSFPWYYNYGTLAVSEKTYILRERGFPLFAMYFLSFAFKKNKNKTYIQYQLNCLLN
jgi:hypothetical protein